MDSGSGVDACGREVGCSGAWSSAPDDGGVGKSSAGVEEGANRLLGVGDPLTSWSKLGDAITGDLFKGDEREIWMEFGRS